MAEPIARIALSMVSNPGAYILVLGSGISRPAGIPTGWEVVEALITRLAVATGEEAPRDPAAWYQGKYGTAPSYTEVVERLAPLPAERAGVLSGFFEATAEERERGLKVPTRAHRAIAELVSAGLVRVIVTTNFDRLLERALEDAGIAPTLVTSDDDLAGMPPLTQVRCLVIKAHGDYLDTRIRNTADEVASLDPGLRLLVESLFRDYGAVIAGWSAEFDAGLRDAMASGPGRYGVYWTARSEPGPEAATLISAMSAEVVKVRDGDAFFSELLEAIRSVQQLLRHGTLDEELAVATVRRLLGSAERRIPLDDLIRQATDDARSVVAENRPDSIQDMTEWSDWLSTLNASGRRLARLFAHIGFWGDGADACSLIRALERLSRWPVEGGIALVLEARTYPALVALYAAGISAVAAKNHRLLAALLSARLPTSGSRGPGDDDTEVASKVLNANQVLDFHAMNDVMNLGVERRMNYYAPASEYLYRTIRPLVADLIPEDAAYERAYDEFEILLAMRYILDGGSGIPPGPYAYRGHRSMVGRGVPERMKAELARDGERWLPVVMGIFASAEQAGEVMTALQERISRLGID